MLEPRRLAAKSIAERLSFHMGEPVGQSVGYRIRFEQKISQSTQIEVLTEGILTRMLQDDNALEAVGLVIFDEFHERSIHADTALALCRESQQVLRNDLRILIMSATLNTAELQSMLQCPVVSSPGRQYPVDIQYGSDVDIRLLPEMMADYIQKALISDKGDILAFLPGQAEILKTEALLKPTARDCSIHPLYGLLPFARQQAAIMPHPKGKRKIVLATNIAETSLTIEGVSIVVDSGFTRSAVFDPNTALTRLETQQITKDAADQRAGRAGRLGPGKCYRLWSKATQDRLQLHRIPEIQEADLCNLALNLLAWGIDNPYSLQWLTPPPRGSYYQAVELLEQLDAMENQKLTDHGQQLLQLPCHPRLGHMLIRAGELGLESLACDVAALLEERDPMGPETGVDINIRLEKLCALRRDNRLSNRWKRIEMIADSYRKLIDAEANQDPSIDAFETGLLLSFAYPERIASARPGNNAQFKLSNGAIAQMHHSDNLAHEAWLSVASLHAGNDRMGRIFLASPLNPQDLAPMVKEKDMVIWDIEAGGLVAEKVLGIGNIKLQSKPLQSPDPQLIEVAIHKVLQKDGEKLLSFTEAVVQWQKRVMSLRQWNSDENWPDVSTTTLLTNTREWLGPYLINVRKNSDLKNLDLLNILNHSLPYEQQEALKSLAPERLTVPSGSNLSIQYFEDGAPPVLAVRIQEIFGLTETPRINKGKTPILLHLLSPGFKPVQVTNDLANFWANTYFEVRKELKGRYPKHHWPDNPLMEQAIKGVKRRG